MRIINYSITNLISYGTPHAYFGNARDYFDEVGDGDMRYAEGLVYHSAERVVMHHAWAVDVQRGKITRLPCRATLRTCFTSAASPAGAPFFTFRELMFLAGATTIRNPATDLVQRMQPPNAVLGEVEQGE